MGRGVRPPGRPGPPPRRRRRAARRAPDPAPPTACSTAFDARLPFTLTDGQQAVSGEIFADLATDHPMHRLLQGEVGSGKTLVALRAMLGVVDAGGQAAMLAPDRGARRSSTTARSPR